MRLLIAYLCLSALLVGALAVAEEMGGATTSHAAEAAPTDGVLSTSARDSILADFREHLARQESRLRRTPLLTKSERRAMRASRNEQHVHAAERLGIEHGTAHGESELLCLDGASPYYVEYDCHARLTDDALASLDVLGQAFHARLRAAGVPLVRYAISSAYRSPAYQAQLRRVNRNAARTTSSHEFGTTYDITYRRFYGDTGAGFDPQRYRLDPRLKGADYTQLGEFLAAEQRRWSSEMATKYASRYAALLGRTLIDLEHEGALLVLREWRQPCYHITVARRMGGA